ncbi:acyltransferase family protein [Alistipes provencensis]|uniref:acyltransferase family protein n=1 Tax=Alistipes provencensis TaxID=1816676 RepID=UPI000A5903FD|nr:acyltransferase [Alistipes provencensis]
MHTFEQLSANTPMVNAQRLEYIDALRGFTIFLVITTHLHAFVWQDCTIFDSIFEAIRMPLFFFISGYLAYTPSLTKEKFRTRIVNRLNKQLKPTLIVWIVYIVLLFYFSTRKFSAFPEYFNARLFDPMKSGYWFTLSLVEIFLIFVTITRICYLKKMKKRNVALIFAICSMLCISISILYPNQHLLSEQIIKLSNLLCIEKTISLSGYFFFGAVCKIYIDQFQKRLSNKGFILCCATIFLIINQTYWGGVIGYKFNSFLGVFITVSSFFLYREYISSSTSFWKFWIHAGKNTLPTYLFHYFFIFILTKNFVAYDYFQIPSLGDLIPNEIIKSIVNITIAVGILWMTLYLDKVLKKLPKVYKLVFG